MITTVEADESVPVCLGIAPGEQELPTACGVTSTATVDSGGSLRHIHMEESVQLPAFKKHNIVAGHLLNVSNKSCLKSSSRFDDGTDTIKPLINNFHDRCMRCIRTMPVKITVLDVTSEWEKQRRRPHALQQ